MFLSLGGAAILTRPYSPSPPPPPPANYIPSPSRPGGQVLPLAAAAPPLPPVTDGRKPPGGPNVPMNDARSDLLAAIRRGQLLHCVYEVRSAVTAPQSGVSRTCLT